MDTNNSRNPTEEHNIPCLTSSASNNPSRHPQSLSLNFSPMKFFTIATLVSLVTVVTAVPAVWFTSGGNELECSTRVQLYCEMDSDCPRGECCVSWNSWSLSTTANCNVTEARSQMRALLREVASSICERTTSCECTKGGQTWVCDGAVANPCWYHIYIAQRKDSLEIVIVFECLYPREFQWIFVILFHTDTYSVGDIHPSISGILMHETTLIGRPPVMYELPMHNLRIGPDRTKTCAAGGISMLDPSAGSLIFRHILEFRVFCRHKASFCFRHRCIRVFPLGSASPDWITSRASLTHTSCKLACSPPLVVNQTLEHEGIGWCVVITLAFSRRKYALCHQLQPFTLHPLIFVSLSMN